MPWWGWLIAGIAGGVLTIWAGVAVFAGKMIRDFFRDF